MRSITEEHHPPPPPTAPGPARIRHTTFKGFQAQAGALSRCWGDHRDRHPAVLRL